MPNPPNAAGTITEDQDECGDTLFGLKVVEKTSWGLTETVVLRGPASTDEEGNRVGPGDIEVKISSPGRMGLGDWFDDKVKYDLEFIEGSLTGREMPRGLLIPHAEVVEKTRWGLSETSRLQADVGQGKVVEVKVSIPWPEENLLEEGQLYAIAIEPISQTEADEFMEPLPETFLENWLGGRIRAAFRPYPAQEAFLEASTPYGPSFWERRKEALIRQDRIGKTAEELLLRPRKYVSLTVVEGLARLQDAINDAGWDEGEELARILEEDDANDE